MGQIKQQPSSTDQVGCVGNILGGCDIDLGFGRLEPSFILAQPLLQFAHAGEVLVKLVAIVGAQVIITDKSTNQSRTATTNETGTFSLATVQTGTYEVTVTMAGFKKYTESKVNVTMNTVTRIDVNSMAAS